jgi:peptidoglycan/xylan/chitin deacetylase (PgdA/CDA1 family)
VSARLLLVTYHYLRDPTSAPFPGIYPLAMGAFAAQVDDLAGRFHIARPEEAERFLLGDGRLPRDSVLFTFDDGLREQGVAARDVLDARGIKALFFVTSRPLTERRPLMVHKVHWLRAHTEPRQFSAEFESHVPAEWSADRADDATRRRAVQQYVYDSPADALLKYRLNFSLPHDVVDQATGRMLRSRGVDERVFASDLYLDREELRGLVSNGHAVGAHGHSHAPMSRLGAGLDADVKRNVDCLASILGGTPRWLSYPYGREWAIPADATALCARHGFQLGVTLSVGWNGPNEDPARIKRINPNEVGSVAAAA